MLRGQRGRLNSIYATCVDEETHARCVQVDDTMDRETPNFVPCPNSESKPRLRGRDLALVKDEVLLWPKGTICYEFKNLLSSTQASNLLQAVNTYVRDTEAVQFLHWSECTPGMGICNDCRIRVEITNDEPGCFAKVGYREDMPRQFNLDSVTPQGRVDFRILHELGHVLGLQHEHQHPDRAVVVVRPLAPGKEIQYWKENGERKTKYDRLSIMHYDKKYLCVPKQQREGEKRFCDIDESPPEADCVIPEREKHCDPSKDDSFGGRQLSSLDILGLQHLYDGALPQPAQEISANDFAAFMSLDMD
ncbi:hypothetical protein Poli38472_000555 [Pythium oligandrum]|uniref:Peptidase metallopeptidase domain-containing protein n=1 Tax=Pythium oligandrum TaxID=41045 RepID=A0A8K1CCJ5_PYTOL|nr:hypothetical protein Poli38472_000555 [Pythium oligandrum]|eukprot:TMW60513.1 hypothetical protein Poli38472_000555 [Pythium oligandrum]